MKIELFLSSIDQEVSTSTLSDAKTRKNRCGELHGSTEPSGTECFEPSSWDNWNNWTNWTNWTNWSNYSGQQIRERSVSFENIIQRLKIRREQFGGLIYDPSTSRVFKVDEEAYNILEYIKRERTVHGVRAFFAVQVKTLYELEAYFRRWAQ